MPVEPSESEAMRLSALRSYAILDTGPELAYDEITELAAQICGCPVAVIGFIDETRDWKKSKYGAPPDYTGMPREISICSATICGNDLLVVPDLSQDERFANNPTVAGEPHLRLYCGMPLINPDGYALGTLCVVDFQPRELTFEQTEAIRRLARQVVSQLELRRSLRKLDERMRQLEEMHAEIAAERDKSNRLLRNILPDSIVRELRDQDRVVPRFYESATVMFADFEGFTRLTERMDPKGLVEQLDQFFSAFDEIAERHRLEKLKTIGDAFMCAGGLPEPSRTHAVDACLAALAMQDYMARVNRQREKLHLPRWELRIGLHTGPVMAGVVGQRKFIYDVWGDAVNIAARMEAAGAAGRINLSEAAMSRVKSLFDFEDRGVVDVKNKGQLRMHFLTRIRRELSRDEQGRVPAETFHVESARLFPGYTAAA
ncbi:MAG: GAF domain-containing protein [Rhodospirillales bacterium]|nr:GAF domain-containing protein [Rhodospirillales bacterium]